ncbi:MAG: zinc ABC transporter substrate-binding protein [Actinobacteria bacterium]|nr:zinc ABC transporter substrate-binding protein [Actinomycetota bacterium]
MKIADQRFLLRISATSLVTLMLVLLTVSLVTGCGKKKPEGKMKVAASIVPLADFCRNVGGDLVEVEVMVPPGASPHSFEPTTEQMMFLSDSSVFVQNGLNLESWATGIVDKVDNKALVEVTASNDIPKSKLLPAAGEPEHENETDRDHSESIYDPHVWLDPQLAIYEVEAIRDGFVIADPDNKPTYMKNTEEYMQKLEELDKSIGDETSTFTKKKFVSFHPSFNYFAKRYGLEQVGVIEELPGKEPGAGEITDLVDKMKQEGVQVIFTEPQFNPQAAEVIASESGAEVVLKSLDPLGSPDNPETSTYIKLIKHNAEVMSEAMNGV